MNKKCICFLYDDLILGGAESYAFRMQKWSKNNNIDFCFIIGKSAKIDTSWNKKIQDDNIIIIRYDIYSNLPPELENYDSLTFIAPNIWNYIKGAILLSQLSVDGNLFFYVLHPFALKIDSNGAKKILYRNLVKTCHKDIVFMDEETFNFAKLTYNKVEFNNNFLRLGMFPNNCSVELKKNKIILTICRMDFPFKGYIKGLLEDFNKLINEGKDIYLKIIGDGKNSQDVYNLIETFEENVKKKIEFCKSIPYDKISTEINNCSLYIGMGTTLLDAANMGVVSIGAVAYQYGNKSFGYFHDNPYILGCVEGVDKYNTHTFKELIEKYFQLPDSDKIFLSTKNKKIISDYYNIDETMKYFSAVQAKSYKDSFMIKGNIMRVNLKKKIYNIFHKKNK